MAYQVPPQWAHGDVPTGALMQKYSDALNAIKAQTDQSRWNAAFSANVSEGVWTFVHVHRYLLYYSTGQIIDPDDDTNSVSLSDAGGWEHYDLQSVPWIYPGKLYIVEGVSGCAEVWWSD